MGRLDTSKPGELRLTAERLRRRAREMTLPEYAEKMERAAAELDAEALALENNSRVWPDGRPILRL